MSDSKKGLELWLPLTPIELKNTNLFTPAAAACLARFSVKSVLINRNSSSTEAFFYQSHGLYLPNE